MRDKDEIMKLAVMRSTSQPRPPRHTTRKLTKLPDIRKQSPYFQTPEILRNRSPNLSKAIKSNSTSIIQRKLSPGLTGRLHKSIKLNFYHSIHAEKLKELAEKYNTRRQNFSESPYFESLKNEKRSRRE